MLVKRISKQTLSACEFKRILATFRVMHAGSSGWYYVLTDCTSTYLLGGEGANLHLREKKTRVNDYNLVEGMIQNYLK
jgi:hypothetical protein